ncbi:unnamed protein product (mitochondrion) [Plasmodiophora brassicae]|uniref:chitin synthase n=1 Tax=Plasmodiophora brassicae TaxID=37360 RepID=A0A3P3XZU2_PLABS|nr:unnamed protein product [Plasmodiophora brassicae]
MGGARSDEHYPGGPPAEADASYEIAETLRYTAVQTRYPVEFTKKGYRCQFAGSECTLLIVVTMYNEGVDELRRTMRGVCENVKTFTQREDDRNFWKRITVCIVSDGRATASQETLEWATEQGIFSQEEINKQMDSGADVGVHLFETTIMWMEENERKSRYPPIQVMFALKEHNAGKIDSHYWFFKAFADQIKPEFCFLLDVGTRPKPKALYFLWETMHRNSQIGGCCGEITTMSTWSANPIVAAQTFEYKVSNFLDKASESVAGYVSVLPGAFSAYRYTALEGAPLDKYFHHIATPMDGLTPFEANQYLAEDRILCFELLAKAGNNYTLHYDKRAIAETDCPTGLVDLIKQRRRWLNGSLLASCYTVLNTLRFLKNTTHTPIRKAVVTMQFLFTFLQLMMAWLLIANVYLTFLFSMTIVLGPDSPLFLILRYIILALIMAQFVLGLGNRAPAVGKKYKAIAVLWSIIFAATTGMSIYTLATGAVTFQVLIAALAGSVGLLLIAATMHGDIVVVLGNFLQYFLVAPVFLVIFPVYSICNLHDISWGTKGISEAAEAVRDDNADAHKDVNERVRARLRRIEKIRKAEKALKAIQQDRFSDFRSTVLLLWILSQGLYVSLITTFDANPGGNHAIGRYFLTVMFGIVAGLNGLRFAGSTLYLIVHQHTKKQKPPAYPSQYP